MIIENLQNIMPKGIEIELISRQAFAAPATGYPSLYNKQQERILNLALKLNNKLNKAKGK